MYSCAPDSDPEIARYTGLPSRASACCGLDACSRTSRSNVEAASSISAHSSPVPVSPTPVTWCGSSAAAPSSSPSASASRRAGSTVTTTTRRPARAAATPRAAAVVVLPTPPGPHVTSNDASFTAAASDPSARPSSLVHRSASSSASCERSARPRSVVVSRGSVITSASSASCRRAICARCCSRRARPNAADDVERALRGRRQLHRLRPRRDRRRLVEPGAVGPARVHHERQQTDAQLATHLPPPVRGPR